MIKYLILFISLTLMTAQASIRDLSLKFKQNNFDLLNLKYDYQKMQREEKKLQVSNTYSLNASTSYLDDNTISNIVYTAIPTTTSDFNLSLSKNFDFGAKISFEQIYNNSFSDKNYIGLPKDNKNSWEAYQKITWRQDLSQNILGKNFNLAEQNLAIKSKLANSQYNIKLEQGLFKLSVNYLNAAMLKDILKLNRQSIKRSNDLLQLVKRRYQDGLAEKSEYLQAQSSYIDSKSQYSNNQIKMNDLLQQIATDVHEKIVIENISPMSQIVLFLKDKKGLSLSDETSLKNKKLQNTNLQIKSFLIKDKLLLLSKQQIQNSFLPKINLQLSYKTNDYNTQSASSALTNSLLTHKNNATAIELSLSYPIGNEEAKQNLKILELDLLKNKQTLVKLKQNLKLKQSYLKAVIQNYTDDILVKKKQINLSKKIVAELYRSYQNGKVDFDKVIRSEEDRIRKEVALLQVLYNFNFSKIKLALLYGNLFKTLTKIN